MTEWYCKECRRVEMRRDKVLKNKCLCGHWMYHTSSKAGKKDK